MGKNVKLYHLGAPLQSYPNSEQHIIKGKTHYTTGYENDP